MEQILLLKNKLTALATGGKLCVAFSGGVDSALLVKSACDAGLDVYAVTFDSTLQPANHRELAANQAIGYGAHHEIICVDPLACAEVRNNYQERCYFCKRSLFQTLQNYAQAHGIKQVLDGTNLDDLSEYRPGLRALRELAVCSPLAELHLTKADVRRLAAQIGLDVANRPSSPCLATRFPYGAVLTPEALHQCGAGESFLQEMGFSVVRLRVHGAIARIEIPREDFAAAIKNAEKIKVGLQALGYEYVTLDFSGYRSGCYDQEEQHGTQNVTGTSA